MDERLGFAPGTVEGVWAVEALTRRFGFAQRQQVLAAALWRTTSRHPSFSMTVDFMTERLVLSNGGRDIRAEVRMFPPETELYAARRISLPDEREPKVTWRGSTEDLVTDLLAVMGSDKLYNLGLAAQRRAEIEHQKGFASEEGESDDDGG